MGPLHFRATRLHSLKLQMPVRYSSAINSEVGSRHATRSRIAREIAPCAVQTCTARVVGIHVFSIEVTLTLMFPSN